MHHSLQVVSCWAFAELRRSIAGYFYLCLIHAITIDRDSITLSNSFVLIALQYSPQSGAARAEEVFQSSDLLVRPSS